jgi:hypothetical protein
MSEVSKNAVPLPTADDGAEWLRYKQVKPRFNMGRTLLDRLAEDGEIRVSNLVGSGKDKGTRLYHVGSIREYIAKKEAETRRKLEAKKLERQGVAV